jgi:transcriptional regulator GlxA family with amidase domain
VSGIDVEPPQLSLTEQKTISAFNQERAASYRHAGDTRIQRAIVLIESRKGRDVSPEGVARTIGLAPRQFARLFQEHVGTTPKRFILETRLRYALFLVENSTMPITAIALETGFSDSAHLTTAFRQNYQSSPSDFRYRRG